ncbi:MAG: AbgT family transporter [Ilumatobacteraceae bacterium]
MVLLAVPGRRLADQHRHRSYFPRSSSFALRYDKHAGIGTVIALMLPYFVALTVVWTAFFAGWYLLDIPWGP